MTKEASKTDTLDAALLRAQSTLKAVGKDATNSFHRYNYTSSEGMLSACREALHSAGLVVRRTHWTIEPGGEFGTLVSWIVCAHPASGTELKDSVAWPIVPEKGRPLDKAVAGALTTSLNYYLRDLLQVPREEETMDYRDDREREVRPQPKPAPKPAPQAAPKPAPKAVPQDEEAGEVGEWTELQCKYVDEGVAGKNQTPYVKVKDEDGGVYFAWDTALHGVLKGARGKIVWVITEPSQKEGAPPRIVQVRTAAPTPAREVVDV